MLLTGRLVQGVDVWINTPRRPWEACGTSGMKVLVNGGLNLSELDGWWAESYTPEVGWALGDGKEHGDDPAWDATEAEALYTILEEQVAPEFYNRDSAGISAAWVARIRKSMSRLTPRFSANRTMREYTEKYYIPAATAFLKRAAGKGAMGMQLHDWLQELQQHWSHIRLGEMKITSDENKHLFAIEVHLNGLDPDYIQVQLYAEGVGDSEPLCLVMARGEQLTDRNGYVYTAEIGTTRPAGDYTPRIVPYRQGALVPLECPLILWQQ